MLETGHNEKKSMVWKRLFKNGRGEMMEVQRAEVKKNDEECG